jgi:ABC-type multidrug transport system permease subunit
MPRAALVALLVTIALAVAALIRGGHNAFWTLFWIALLCTVILGMFVFVRYLVAATTKRNPKY